MRQSRTLHRVTDRGGCIRVFGERFQVSEEGGIHVRLTVALEIDDSNLRRCRTYYLGELFLALARGLAHGPSKWKDHVPLLGRFHP